MDWVDNFDLFLFDFDGLLVHTEKLHFVAYQKMVQGEGEELPWDFATFCSYAHRDSETLRREIRVSCPSLSSNWADLYQKKKAIYERLLEEGNLEYMEGVEVLLPLLEKKGKKRAIVTNSFFSQVESIARHLPLLRTIPAWITREAYAQPKPSPECYQQAIARYSEPSDRIVGMEDSWRGIQALQQTRATPIWITPLLQEKPPFFSGIFCHSFFDISLT